MHNASQNDRLTELLYKSSIGRFLLKLLVLPFVTKLAGAFLDSCFSAFMINGFIKKHQIDMTPYCPARYSSFNEFFTRKIIPGYRPLDVSPYHLISPCDSKVTACKIDENCLLNIKGSVYSLEDLLKSPSLAREYTGGDCLIFRLEATDYHHYCYIDDGIQKDNVYIKGIFHSVQPIAIYNYPVFKQNSRSYTQMDTKHFEKVTQIEVGAMLVGKITNLHDSHSFVRGEEKGYFEFGGSTIVMLFKKNVISLCDTILLNSSNDMETVVKMGEQIGIRT